MISLIISFYKRLDFLDLILQSIEKQSFRDFEVIVAEDNNDPSTTENVARARLLYKFNILHRSQEDTGFRKTRILNDAVRSASGEKLVFIDGDCVLHRHFLKAYNESITENNFCYGRRVYCSGKHTGLLLASRSIEKCTIWSAILLGGRSIGAGFYFPVRIKRSKQSRRILGCNWGIMKKNILAVNGYDEDYTRAGVGEDFDIDWRLKKQGLRINSMKGRAIVFHLHHKPNYSPSDTDHVEKLMAEKKEAGETFCRSGILKIK